MKQRTKKFLFIIWETILAFIVGWLGLIFVDILKDFFAVKIILIITNCLLIIGVYAFIELYLGDIALGVDLRKKKYDKDGRRVYYKSNYYKKRIIIISSVAFALLLFEILFAIYKHR